MRSTTRYAVTLMTFEFAAGTDIFWARAQVNERLAQVQDQLPQGVSGGLAPIVTGFAPIGGKPGDPIVLTGINFTTATNVAFNGSNATFHVTSDTQISATVPVGATTGPISASNGSGASVTSSNFIIGPFITDFSPVAAAVGDLSWPVDAALLVELYDRIPVT